MKLALSTFTNRLHPALAGHASRWSATWGWIDTTRSRIVLLVCVVVLGLTYLWLVNNTATAGFYLSDLEQQRLALEDEYESLELEQAAVSSLEYIQQRGQALELVGSGRAAYISGDSAVALGDTE